MGLGRRRLAIIWNNYAWNAPLIFERINMGQEPFV